MTFGRLRDLIAYEAGIPDIDALGGWLDVTLQELFDQHTSVVKFPELIVLETQLTITPPFTGILALPTNLQHLNTETIRYRPAADQDEEQYLNYSNEDTTRITSPADIYNVYRNGNSLQFYPTLAVSLVNTSSVFIIDYWKKVSLTALTTVIIPDQLVIPVKLEAVARTMMQSSSKMAGAMFNIADKALSRSRGATDLGSQN